MQENKYLLINVGNNRAIQITPKMWEAAKACRRKYKEACYEIWYLNENNEGVLVALSHSDVIIVRYLTEFIETYQSEFPWPAEDNIFLIHRDQTEVGLN